MLVCVSSALPIKPPTRLTGRKLFSQGRMAGRCWRLPNMPPLVPSTSASVLVAFATTGVVPKASSVGNVSNVPPPATALIAPAPAADRTRPKISQPDIMGTNLTGFGPETRWEKYRGQIQFDGNGM